MKILAIRGRNIASLAGEFELDLVGDPLGQAGIFAITGPTGSGKSTLLDALCLPLFDKVPRLVDAGRTQVRRDESDTGLTAQDVRNLLRHGTGWGYAEVDFEGIDHIRYRARWQVHRARQRPDGNFQSSTISVLDLDADQPLGDTRKTETLDLISEKLGLTFDQFRRSALLAQGDFAAFLQARPKQRAELLERMTGTDIYARLSSAAYERAQLENQALADLERRLAGLGVLTTEDREALQHTVGESRARLDALERQAAAIGKQVEWFDRHDQLERQVQDREAELRTAEAAAQAQRVWEKELQEVKRLRVHRGPLDRLDETRQRVDAARRQREALTAQVEEAQRQARALRTERGEAEAAERGAIQARSIAQPRLDAATRLDAQLSAAEAERAQASARATEASRVSLDATNRARELEAEATGWRERQAGAQQWLEGNPDALALAQDWDAQRGALKRIAEIGAALAALGSEDNQLQQKLASATERLNTVQTELDRATERLKDTQKQINRSNAVLQRRNLDEQRRDLKAREELLRDAERVYELAQKADSEKRQSKRALAEAADADNDTQRADGSRAAAQEQLAALAPELAKLERRVNLADATLSLEERRAELESGEPCPLCGSPEHPFVDHGPASELAAELHDERDALLTRQAELQQQLQQARQERASAIAKGEAKRVEADRRRAEADKTLKERERNEQRLADAGYGADGLFQQTSFGARGIEEQLGREIAELRARLLESEERAQAITRLQRETVDIGRECEVHRAALERAKTLLRDLDARRVAVEAEARTLRATRGELEAPLRPELRGSGGSVDPNQFRQLERQVDEVLARQRVLREATDALAALGSKPALATQAAHTAAAALATEQARAVESAAQVERLRGERQALFPEAVAARRAQLDAAVESARTRASAARGGSETADQGAAAAAASLQAHDQVLRTADAEHRRAHQALDAALAVESVTEERLRELLARPEAWVEEQEATLRRVTEDVSKRKAVLEDRRKDLGQHLVAPDRPHGDATDARAALATQRQDLKAVVDQLQQHLRRLETDDEARAHAAALDTQIQAQRVQQRTWAQLQELIGSSDGGKFREFAQGLTLDALLQHANRHLEELARRYRLIRVPGKDLEIQALDLDMGDEVRSVHSLSGGETFLVSLALALGLSSLSATNTQVESLFIDEGFGTLDRETLDTALAALDALQATGRKVGIISHVQGLADHIGVQVRVVKQGAGRSRVEVHGVVG